MIERASDVTGNENAFSDTHGLRWFELDLTTTDVFRSRSALVAVGVVTDAFISRFGRRGITCCGCRGGVYQ